MGAETLPDGAILGWYILDPETLIPCLKCGTRDEARDVTKTDDPAEEPWAIIAKMVKAH